MLILHKVYYRHLRFTCVAPPLGKHEVKQGVKHELKTLFFTSFLAKFTLLGAEVGTTIINTGQPPPPVSKQRAPQVIHRLHTGAELSTGPTKVIHRLQCWHGSCYSTTHANTRGHQSWHRYCIGKTHANIGS